MATLKKEIFLASRFEEFKEIRAKLAEKIDGFHFMEAIDLNDNQASYRSPLEESLFHVRKAEIMILLVGETYGTVPEGEEYSYTHLEYKEAIKESSNTRVLVFCIGKPYAGKFIDYAKDDPKMKAWQLELEKNHRLSKFGDAKAVDEIVEKIMITLLSSVHDLNPQENLRLVEDDELYLDDLGDDEENFLYDAEAELLDNKLSDQNEIDIANVSEDEMEGFDLLKIPGKLAALEQKKEAQIAIEIQDYYTARQHLKKALEFRPLDFETNYWLAKLYVASAKKDRFFEIEEYLLRAAKIALQENSKYKASNCYQLIIQASIFSDKENEGRKYIELAEEITPNFARLYYEKAKFMLYFGHKKEAKHALTQALNIRMEILKDIVNDPFFLAYKDTIQEVKEGMKEHLKKSCYAIWSQTNQIRNILGMETEQIDLDRLSIYALWKKSRNTFIEQYGIISSAISEMEDNEKHLHDDGSIYFEKKHEDAMQHINYKALDRISEYKSSTQGIYGFSLITALLSLVIAIGMIVQGSLLEYLWMVIVVLLFSSGSFLYLHKTRKKKMQEIEREKDADLKREEDRYRQMKENYKNISRAFKVFEEGTVSKSSSKLVPFRSLNNAAVGSIVRVTPSSFRKFEEQGKDIEIREGFPIVLNIEEVNTDKYSFLAKVVKRNYDGIVLSRAKAYKIKKGTV